MEPGKKQIKSFDKNKEILSMKQTKYLPDVYIMSALKYCPLIWMFYNKSSNYQITKIHKRTLRLVYEMEDAKFEALQINDNSWYAHENNMHALLTETHRPINNLSSPIMKDFFDLKNT